MEAMGDKIEARRRMIAAEVPVVPGTADPIEDDETLSFMDINPASEGHALVIPKQHSADVHAVSEDAIMNTVITMYFDN